MMVAADSKLETKLDRIESAIIRLTEISSDLKSMIVVNDIKLAHQEKETESLAEKFEKRRDLMDEKIKDIYETINKKDDRILEEIKAIREEHNKHYTCLNDKITSIQKYVWLAIGGVTMFTWLFFYIGNYFLKFMH